MGKYNKAMVYRVTGSEAGIYLAWSRLNSLSG